MPKANAQPTSFPCLFCGAQSLEISPAYSAFKRVTSDCKPWPAGGFLARCRSCHLVQTVTTPEWHAEATQIYQNYTIYYQGAGAEQAVFVDGKPMARSDVIARFLADRFKLPATGRMLDVGCGNGAFLRACSRALPGWRLCGAEFDNKHEAAIAAIPNTEKLYTGSIKDIPGTFDLISTIHVLEHIADPRPFLADIRAKLNPGGLLLVEVPDCLRNPYMILIADHCSHFSASVLAQSVANNGFEVLFGEANCVPKEITLVARKSSQSAESVVPQQKLASESAEVFAGFEFLQRVARTAGPLTSKPQFGIFGSSIAAVWLNAQLNGAAQFFVDEDPNRIGRSLMDKPIIAPAQIPDGATIFVALPSVIAEKVIPRLKLPGKNVEIVSVA